MRELAQRYAKALYGLTRDEGPLRTAAQELTGNPALWAALTSAVVRPEEKKRVMLRLLDPLEPVTAHFLCLLADKGRMELLPDVVGAFHTLVLAGENAAEAVMICAHPPAPDQVQRLEVLLCRRLGLDAVHVRVQTDPGLLGGFVVRTQDMTYDYSVRGRLRALERQLDEVRKP